MNWRFAPQLDGAPAGWSDTTFATAREALAQGRLEFDGPIYTAWVRRLGWADQLPSARTIVAEAAERAALQGFAGECFDRVTPAELAVLDDVLKRATANWEQWLPAETRSDVLLIENLELHLPPA